MRMTAAPLALCVVLLAACGGSDLEADDPAGYEACVRLGEAVGIDDDPLMRMGVLFEVSERAEAAQTAEIREAVEQVGDTPLADSDALAEACEANGVDVP